jgi:hypothetical protein
LPGPTLDPPLLEPPAAVPPESLPPGEGESEPHAASDTAKQQVAIAATKRDALHLSPFSACMPSF